MMSSWFPWTLLLTFLPSSATDLLKDEGERQRLREEATRMAKDYSKLFLLWAFRVAQVFVGISFLFMTAAVLYIMLYYLVIPSRYHEQEIFFNYGDRHEAIIQPSDGYYVPTASLDLRDPVHQWKSMVPTSTQATSPVLVPGVKYDVIVELTVPESRMNADVGVFMVSTLLWEAENERRLAHSARPVTLHNMPSLVRWLRLGFWLVPYALGLTEPAQTIRVTAINGYMESSAYPLTHVDLEINTPKVQVYSAKLIVIAQLTGVRYLMYHWAVPTAVLFILNIVFLEALVLVILYAVYVFPQLEKEAAADTSVLEAAAATAVLEAAATDAREKAKKLFEKPSSSDVDTSSDVKGEVLMAETSFSTTEQEKFLTTQDVEDAPKEAEDL
ncbi:hypothetical protein PsorP6_001209 [Peronosclerospora sorghi]|uniref:Uncharacterized protein n=1 Tax=Peronosclerospora sorghi TaxID=230839 RepID=A0ACC0WPT9_9STRA|nr:hypothetical protein PsorP6_001209 [Peronosclerospora sorghi]